MHFVWMLLLAILITLYSPNTTLAAQDTTDSALTVFPAILDVPSAKGQSAQSSFTITNNSDRPLPLALEVSSLLPADAIIDLSKRSQFDASRWVNTTPAFLAIDTGQSKEISVAITVPEDATAGDHYAEIAVKELRIDSDTRSGVAQSIIAQVKIPIFIQLGGDTKQELIIESGDTFRPLYQQRTTHTTTFRVANTGTTHLLPSFNLSLTQGGETIQTETFTPGIILPNTTKTISHSWTPQVPVGTYDIGITAHYGTDKIARMDPERTGVVFPLYLLAIGGIILCIAGYIFVKRKHLNAALHALAGDSE